MMMKIVQKLWAVAGLPCRECGGKGYVVDSDIERFIERNGLALYQAADTLMMNEIEYGALGSLPVSAWEELGLSEDQALEFATEVGHCHTLHGCRTCNGQENHPDPLKTATDVINSHRERNRRRYTEWKARVTPEQRRQKWRTSAWIAVQHAQMSRDLGNFDNEAGLEAEKEGAFDVP